MRELEKKTLRGQYFLRRFVDSGGMADVYLAWDQVRSVQLAVKVLRRELANNERFTQMFMKEAQLLQTLAHPHIVRLYEFNQEHEIAFIVLDWIDGENVRRMIMQQKRPLTLEETARIIEPVSRALNYAHQLCVYHCDVKPANILLHTDGRVLLTDFGVARHAAGTSWGGTPVYMAPEQFPELSGNGGRVDGRTDVYSLGVTIYEMLSGGWVPFRGDTPGSQGNKTRERIAWEIRNVPLLPVSRINPQVPRSVDQVIQVALSREAERRFKTTIELNQAYAEAVRAARGTTGRMAAPMSNQNTQPRPVPPPIPQGQPARNPVPPAPQPNVPQSGPSTRLQPAPPPSEPKRAEPYPQQGDQLTLKLNSPLPIPSTSLPEAQPAINLKGPHLIGRSGEWQGKAIEVPRGAIQIGRNSTTQVQIREPSISRLHMSIVRPRFGRVVYLRDENSRTGVLLNDQRVPAGTLIELKDGDRIQIGQYQVFEFRNK